MELIHIYANATFSSSSIKSNQLISLENLASKTKLTKLLKSTRCALGRRAIRRARPEGWARVIVLGIASVAGEWWSQPGSNRRPSGCKPDALPAELWPLPGWWVWEELHLRPHPYQGCALTN
jgi:hypothetical protein